MSVDFTEAAFGCEKSVTVDRSESCPTCKGNGCAHGTTPEVCPECHGTGTVTQAAPTLTAPTSRMQDSDIASLVQLRQTVESVVQFVQGAASGTQSAS